VIGTDMKMRVAITMLVLYTNAGLLLVRLYFIAVIAACSGSIG